MSNITKSDLANAVAEKTDLNKGQAKEVIDAVLGAISEQLEQGNRVQITGFGTFEVRQRSARQGVKPGTSEKIDIPAVSVPAFKPGKGLKERVSA